MVSHKYVLVMYVIFNIGKPFIFLQAQIKAKMSNIDNDGPHGFRKSKSVMYCRENVLNFYNYQFVLLLSYLYKICGGKKT